MKKKHELARRLKQKKRVFRLVNAVCTDFRVAPADPIFRAGLILIGAFFVGTKEVALRQLTGETPAFISRVAARCRKARLWRGSTVRCEWLNEKDGDWAFMLDAMVACGIIARADADKQRAARKRDRQARIDAGRCSNCGGERDTDLMTCGKCLASQRRSQARRADLKKTPMAVATVEARYSSREVSPENVTDHPPEPEP